MALENTTTISFGEEHMSAKIVKWNVDCGSKISKGMTLFSYQLPEKKSQTKYKSTNVGTVIKILIANDQMINKGDNILILQNCLHPVVMKDMCAECGLDLKEITQGIGQQCLASVAMVHSIPELKVSQEQAHIIGKADEKHLLASKKLALLVDLDQTLIHTTNDDIPPDIIDVFHFQLYGKHSPWYHTRLRPGTKAFLRNISQFYELHICTFGARLYAHEIARLLDPDGSLFSKRILSRDECFNPLSKTANLKALFPCGDSMVCIIDDRDDVWNYAPNLVQVKPYHFFQHTGDINAPPNLSKTEILDETVPADEKELVTDSKPSIINSKEMVTESKEMTTKSKEMDTESRERTTDCKEMITDDIETATAITDNAEDSNLPEEKQNDTIRPVETCTESTGGSNVLNSVSDQVKMELSDFQKLYQDDNDDHLLHLEDKLRVIHRAYYEMYEQMKEEENSSIPDIKYVVPYVRRKVLKTVFVVFSGVIPTNMSAEKSRAWIVAKSLGAVIQNKVTSTNDRNNKPTTHIVAARLGTQKVNEAKKLKNVHIVNPDWLWCCAERWEKVDESLFPLVKTDLWATKLGKDNLNNRMHENINEDKGKTKGNQFSTTINPLLSFTSEDIAQMDQEVDDMINEGGEENSDEEESSSDQKSVTNKRQNLYSDSEDESLSADYPTGWNPRKKRNANSPCKNAVSKIARRSDEDSLPSDRSDQSSDDDYAESIGSVDEEMAAAVEREFLAP
uniref:RNA polymerase II subunit A C-terminal domain phosphatase n=1 Tax=Strigamia maritima TaxID=126957 RepID=T1IZ83_STRMM